MTLSLTDTTFRVAFVVGRRFDPGTYDELHQYSLMMIVAVYGESSSALIVSSIFRLLFFDNLRFLPPVEMWRAPEQMAVRTMAGQRCLSCRPNHAFWTDDGY